MAFSEVVHYRAPDQGLSVKATMGSSLTLATRRTVTADEMDWAIDIIADCLKAAAC
jgi:hypothetical protein